MTVVADCCLQWLLRLIVIYGPKGYSWFGRAFEIHKVILGLIEKSWPKRACMARKGVLVLQGHIGAKGHLRPESITLSQKGFGGPKGNLWPER